MSTFILQWDEMDCETFWWCSVIRRPEFINLAALIAVLQYSPGDGTWSRQTCYGAVAINGNTWSIKWNANPPTVVSLLFCKDFSFP